MAFLNLKRNKIALDETAKTVRKLAVKESSKPALAHVPLFNGELSGIIIRPRVTEKAALLSERDREVHVFEVSRNATKRKIAEAVKGLYKVTPLKIAIIKVPAKSSFVRGRMSKGKIGRKAYVYLKEGDKIEN